MITREQILNTHIQILNPGDKLGGDKLNNLRNLLFNIEVMYRNPMAGEKGGPFLLNVVRKNYLQKHGLDKLSSWRVPLIPKIIEIINEALADILIRDMKEQQIKSLELGYKELPIPELDAKCLEFIVPLENKPVIQAAPRPGGLVEVAAAQDTEPLESVEEMFAPPAKSDSPKGISYNDFVEAFIIKENEIYYMGLRDKAWVGVDDNLHLVRTTKLHHRHGFDTIASLLAAYSNLLVAEGAIS